MTNQIACEHCQVVLPIPISYSGRKVRCPKCSQSFVVPTSGAEVTQEIQVTRDTELHAPNTLHSTLKTSIAGGNGPAKTLGKIGRFEMREILGQGAFGRVYRAYDPQLDREVALKVPTFGPQDKHKINRFLTEAKAAAGLRHPHIVPTFESGQVDGRYYIATQYVKGKTLSQTIKSELPTVERSVRMVVSIARALAYAHHEGIVHRDVKPDNIMLDARGEPQLMDFGLAKRLNEDSGLTTEGTLMGTPAYMSPEQARADTANVGPRSDQYAVGAILYELLCGKRAFDGPPHSVLAQLLSQEPPPIRTIKPSIPKDLEAIAQKAMCKEAQGRYENCGALADDLERWSRGETTLARPTTLVERWIRWSRRNKTLATLTTATAAAIFIAITGITAALIKANAARIDAVEQRQRADEKTSEATKQTQLAHTEKQRAEQQSKEALRAKEEATQSRNDAIAARNEALASSQKVRDAFDRERAANKQLTNRIAENNFQRGIVELSSDRFDDGIRSLYQAYYLSAEDNPLRASYLRVLADRFRKQAQRFPRNNFVPYHTFSSTGDLLTIACHDGRADVWDARTGLLVGTPLITKNSASAIAMDPFGKTIAVGMKGKVVFWDFRNGRTANSPLEQENFFPEIQYSQDGEYLLTRQQGSTARMLWNCRESSPKGVVLKHPAAITSASISPDSKSIITCGLDKSAKLWSTSSGSQIGKDFLHNDGVGCVSYAPDGSQAVTGAGNYVYFWDLVKKQPLGEPLQQLEIAEGQTPTYVRHITYSPDGTRIVAASSGSVSSTVRVWVVEQRKLLWEMHLSVNKIHNLTFSPDGSRILISCNKDVHLCNSWTGEKLDRFHNYTNWPAKATFRPDGCQVVTSCDDHSVRLWDARTDEPRKTPLPHQSTVTASALSPTSNFIATGDQTGKVYLWDAVKCDLLQIINHKSQVDALAFAPNGQMLASASQDMTVKLWDLKGGNPFPNGYIPELQHNTAVTCLAFSPDGGRIATGCKNGDMRLWDTQTHQPLSPVFKHGGQVFKMTFSPDGKTLLTASSDRTARYWSGYNGNSVGGYISSQSEFVDVCYSPDGTRIMTTHGNSAQLIQAGKTARLFEYAVMHAGIVFATCFSNDGKKFVSCGADKAARICDGFTAQPLTKPLLHEGPVRAACFSPDGSLVLTGSDDKTARIWDAQTGEPLGVPLQHPASVQSVAFNADGKSLLTCCADKQAFLWKLEDILPAYCPPKHAEEYFQTRTRQKISPENTFVPITNTEYENALAAMDNQEFQLQYTTWDRRRTLNHFRFWAGASYEQKDCYGTSFNATQFILSTVKSQPSLSPLDKMPPR